MLTAYLKRQWKLLLLLAGAVGNLIDRALQGYVVDMFHVLFMEFAVFNVADICVVVGGFAAVVYYLFFYEKLEGKPLAVVRAVPEGECYVYADGRHLWRVIDNLLSNCAKYALEGSRVYMEIYYDDKKATLSLKNISREALNVPVERLMERFVRGDAARGGEGNGLGLSIARSLTELQKGTLELTVDGDLFKVVLRFGTIS